MSKKLQVVRNIPASASRIWEVLGDYPNVDRFHPVVEHVDGTSGPSQGVGAVRRCNFYDGSSVVEEVVEWVDGEGFTVELRDGSMPLLDPKARMLIVATGPNSADVSIEMEYTPKFGPLGSVMNVLMIKPMMKKMFGKVLGGLEHHVTHGEIIGKDFTPLAKVA